MYNYDEFINMIPNDSVGRYYWMIYQKKYKYIVNISKNKINEISIITFGDYIPSTFDIHPTFRYFNHDELLFTDEITQPDVE